MNKLSVRKTSTPLSHQTAVPRDSGRGRAGRVMLVVDWILRVVVAFQIHQPTSDARTALQENSLPNMTQLLVTTVSSVQSMR